MDIGFFVTWFVESFFISMAYLVLAASGCAVVYASINFNLQRVRLNGIDRRNQTDRQEAFYLRNAWFVGAVVSTASVIWIAYLMFGNLA
ncbi:hypothetical protein L0Y69_02290 [bacterium]|nr:hypothetical protein [bacterium]